MAPEGVGEEEHRVGDRLGMVYLEVLHSLAHGDGVGEEVATVGIVVTVGRDIEGGDVIHRMGRGGIGGDIALHDLAVFVISGCDGGSGSVGTCGMEIFTVSELCELGTIEEGEEVLVEERLARHVDVNGGVVGGELARPVGDIALAIVLDNLDGALGDHGRAHGIGDESAEVVDGDGASHWVVSLAEQLFALAGDGNGSALATYLEGEGVERTGEQWRRWLVGNCNHINVSLKRCKDRKEGEKIKIPDCHHDNQVSTHGADHALLSLRLHSETVLCCK